jgi:hypothetical protein
MINSAISESARKHLVQIQSALLAGQSCETGLSASERHISPVLARPGWNEQDISAQPVRPGWGEQDITC